MILLDTHALIWMDANDVQMGNRSRTLIEQAWRSGTVAVSAISGTPTAVLSGGGLTNPATVVGGEHVPPDRRLTERQELALLLPMSGG